VVSFRKAAMSPKSLYRLFAVGEAITWALLISALVLRVVAEDLSIGVTIAGTIHGAMFLSYCTTAVLVGINQRWKFGKIAAAVSLAIVPFATVPFDRSLLKKGQLEGAWRTEASDHPADKTWIDKLFRWFIARPLVLIVVLVLAVTALFIFLLFLGPPTEWFD
jgi:integral membrane protein